MAERTPSIYSIAAHRGFADALVAGLVPRYREEGFGLARLTLLLPTRRTVRIVTEAFIRASGADGGLLLPRMAVVGDLDLDETLGPLLDPLGQGADLPPAADPAARLLELADMLRSDPETRAATAPGLLRQARALAQAMDRLAVEDVELDSLLDPDVIGLVGELAEHWQRGTAQFARILVRWRARCEERGEIDAPVRRNRLLGHVAERWRREPPPHPVVAAGVTSAAPAVARLLRVVSELPQGAVILPDLDLALPDAVWDALGAAGNTDSPGAPVFAHGDVATHPQYHLKLLLARMGIGRDEVQAWHRSGPAAAPPERSRAISNLFLPPEASTVWAELPAEARRLSGVRLMETAHPEEEAQAVAVLVRQALGEPDKRVAVITPDRDLAQRLVAHLERWGIAADDTAGRPLSQAPAGRVLLQLAEVAATSAAPVPLLALLAHPLVRRGEDRAAWLERVRHLDLVLRGPRPGPGLEAVRGAVAAKEKDYPGLTAWWDEAAALLAPLVDHFAPPSLALGLDTLAETAEALCGPAIWGEADGRALAAFIEQWREAAQGSALPVEPADLHPLLSDALSEIAVRPPYGGHPRLAIYGLLEARMSRADLVICAGMSEGKWPASPAPDPLLAPPVLRALGIPGADFRIGLAAHDLAAALGAPEVVLSHAMRDAGGPVIPSRFLLRIRAMLGRELEPETEAVRIARALDKVEAAQPYLQPAPRPSAEQRRVSIASTALDRLRGDPYQFYASAIMGLRTLDPLDAAPTAAWRGTMVHAVLQRWHDEGSERGRLLPLAEQTLDELSAHPFMRGLWRPRLLAALQWVEDYNAELALHGRRPVLWEKTGAVEIKGVKLHGRADRIDRLADGTLAVVDYKTGKPPSGKMVEEGYALQLGLIALIAERGGFEGLGGKVHGFEYWSLQKKSDVFGYCEEPVPDGKRKKTGLPRETFVSETLRFLSEAIDKWILGDAPFTARPNPDLPGYTDYDQLMRLEEWQGRGTRPA
ncbi:double-strand break repair protein AddB [Novosphingobium sediminis]|uniref:Double-strand break repair protein AddB n=1 Tax=Novosphingobium sediminis TaxID=707214 RepID=A0A512AFL2_9SPHN|nr:double-strand break repair protein AddB [Novosphingobium sediminis]GEN98497.1 double-strand break repair protein AddB [Novosphingobium sediminis]